MPIILDKVWYFYLIKNSERVGESLEEHVQIHTPGLLIIHAIFDELRMFTSFSSIQEFIEYQSLFDIKDRAFFETILSVHQKMYYDIDISSKLLEPGVDIDKLATDVINSLVSALIFVLDELKTTITPEDLCMFSSNSSDKSKRSYHVVTSKLCVKDNIENKQIYYMIKKRVSEEHMKYIDSAMYSSIQEFRIVGSQKPGSGRTKTFMSTWYYMGKAIKHQFPESILNLKGKETISLMTSYIFEMSLISQIYDCDIVKDFSSNPNAIIKKKNVDDDDDIKLTNEDIEDVVSRLPKGAYKKNRVKGAMITFSRLAPTDCAICKRIHENENPYITVNSDGEIRFFCRRSNRSLLLGMLKSKVFEEKKEEPKVYGNIISALMRLSAQ